MLPELKKGLDQLIYLGYLDGTVAQVTINGKQSLEDKIFIKDTKILFKRIF